MSDILVTPKDVVDHLRTTDAAVDALDAALRNCRALSPVESSAWSSFRDEYRTFAAEKEKQWDFRLLIPFVTLTAFDLAQLRSDDERIIGYERTIRQWQDLAARRCPGSDTPRLTPRDDPSSPGNAPGAGLFGGAIQGAKSAAELAAGVALLAAGGYALIVAWPVLSRLGRKRRAA